jgi:lipopolysaccharide transport system ATP-binding protein
MRVTQLNLGTGVSTSSGYAMNTATDFQDLLVQVTGVSKKFCRDLKKSLWYGIQDAAAEFNPLKHFKPNREGQLSVQTLREDEFWAVKNVSFELRRGECLGLIGSNGAGKTTLLKMVNGLIRPDAGRIEIRGQIGALIALGAGFNPILTGRENIYVNASVLGLKKREVEAKLEEIIDFAEIGPFIDAPVQTYSAGMTVRLGFAVATALEPDVLLLDEVLAVGDAEFRAKCFGRISKCLSNAAVVFVSHSEAQVRRICNRALWLDQGETVQNDIVDKVLADYQSRALRVAHEIVKRPVWILGSGVVQATAAIANSSLGWGDNATITISLCTERTIKITNIYIQWHRSGEAVAHSEVIDSEASGCILGIGTTVLEITTEPLRLVQGNYEVSVAVFEADGKATVAHCISALSVVVTGRMGGGPAVLVPVKWRIVSNQ